MININMSKRRQIFPSYLERDVSTWLWLSVKEVLTTMALEEALL